MKISIALATFNGESYIEEQLESIALQTVKPDEIVVSDDNSNDETVERVKQFAKKHQNIEFLININPTNKGYSQNFNEALIRCTGDVVFLADQDDVWYPQKIESMTRYLNTSAAKKLVVHDLMFCNSNLVRTGQTKLERVRNISNPLDTYIVGMATALKQELLELCLPIPSIQSITYDNWIHTFANTLNQKHILNDILADYRRHDSNATVTASINTAAKMNKIDYIKAVMSKDSQIISLENHITLLENVSDRLEKTTQQILQSEFLSSSELTAAKHLLETKIDHTESRLNALTSGFLSKRINVLLNYLSGKYKYFNGFKSAIKDCL